MTQICIVIIIYRFKLGLSTLDVLDAIRKFPQAFQPAFCHTETKLTSQEIDQMFSIVMESQGSNKRQTQSKVTGWWRDYLIDAQGLYCPNFIQTVNRGGLFIVSGYFWDDSHYFIVPNQQICQISTSQKSQALSLH